MAERRKIVIPQIYKDKYGDYFPLWSYSKVSGIRSCVWEYYLGRILKKKGDSNIYSELGTSAHDCLESFYKGEIPFEGMLEKFEKDFLNVEMCDYKFSADEERHYKMSDDYKSCVTNFFKTHDIIPYKLLTEKEIWIDVNGNVFFGYIDAIHKEDDGTFIITDWKTSTIYKGSQVYEHQKQLLLYALGMNQLGIPIEKIKIRWNFLKYVNINFTHMVNVTYTETTPKETKEKTSCCLRSEWVSKVKTQLKKDIVSYYENEENRTFTTKELKAMIDRCVLYNNLDYLPKEIKDKYVLADVVKTAKRSAWTKESPIQTQLRKDLKLAGVDDVSIEMLLFDCAEANSLEPIKDKVDITNYKFNDGYVYGVINDETIQDLINELCGDIELINSKNKEDEKDWEREPIGEADSFYCSVLCGHRKNCKYYKDYKDEKLKYTGVDVSIDTQSLLDELANL